MKTLNTILAAATVICSIAGTSAQAAPLADKPADQHYVFTYHFDRRVDPVLKSFVEMQQYVQYQVALDVVHDATDNLRRAYEETSMMAATSADQAQEQLLAAAE